MPTDVDVLVDELYALPLERFVPERTVLARQLRAEGRREEAAQVAALAKPAIAAWAVNQVVRAQPAATQALWDAGDAVLDTQAQVMDGAATGPELRASIEVERRALGPLTEAARGLVTSGGRFLAEPQVQAVVETLHAAAIDPAARETVAAARLSRPLRLTGLEAALAGGGANAERAVERRRLAARDERDDGDEAARRQDERERRARRDAARQALLRAERARDGARERITAAVASRDGALAAREEAERRLEAAAAEVEAAEGRLAGAHAALEDAEGAVERAQAGVEDAA